MSTIISAAEVAIVLGGARRNGRGWLVCCPVHDDRAPSLSLHDGEDGRLLVRCFAGCDPLDILRSINLSLSGRRESIDPKQSEVIRERARIDAKRRTEFAREIWRQTLPAGGGP